MLYIEDAKEASGLIRACFLITVAPGHIHALSKVGLSSLSHGFHLLRGRVQRRGYRKHFNHSTFFREDLETPVWKWETLG